MFIVSLHTLHGLITKLISEVFGLKPISLHIFLILVCQFHAGSQMEILLHIKLRKFLCVTLHCFLRVMQFGENILIQYSVKKH
jgi:hypothetical protein